jgi:hypothetical protein
MPLPFLGDSYLTITAPMNLRGLRPGNLGVFPYGTPAYLAFHTDCAHHLLGK